MQATSRQSAPLPRHFLDIRDLDSVTLRRILDFARACKRGEGEDPKRLFAGRTLALIFERPSTRTRVSFELAMRQLGGETIVLTGKEMQLGRGETIADTARVLSRYVDAVMLRTDRVAKLQELAAAATIPIINGLSDLSHPCQIIADVMTFEEHRGPIAGQPVAWLGDGNNVARSLVEAAVRFGFPLTLACPPHFVPDRSLFEWAEREGSSIRLTQDPEEAARGARLVVTDTWVSMQDERTEERLRALAPYQVNAALMRHATQDALFMHCLPAHRGEEVTDEVMDGPHSVVFDEAENRLHAQKGILVWALGAIG